MIKKILKIPVYPYLVAVAPVLSLFVINRLDLVILDLARPAAIYLIVAIVAVAISRLFCRTNQGASLLGSVLILSVATYGFGFFLLVDPLNAQEQSAGFFTAWLAGTGILYLSLIFFLRKMRGSLNDITMVFNIFSMVIILAAILPLMTANPATEMVEENKTPAFHEWLPTTDRPWDKESLPDVYYIIFDAYARQDVLHSRYDFDNAEFIQWLQDKGFFVGEKSHANYPWTHLSLTATLNGEYLDTLVPRSIQEDAPDDYQLRYLYTRGVLAKNYLKASRVHRLLSELGYRIISNDSGYAITRFGPTSLMRSLSGATNQFEEMLITQTMARPLISRYQNTELVQDLQVSIHDQVIGALDDLKLVAREHGPKFVFFHIVSPHGPFGFNEQGGPIPPHPLYDASPWAHDKFAIDGFATWYRENYSPNLTGLNGHIRTAFESIMETTAGNAIIIIQSDHGPLSGFDVHSSVNTDVVERFGILNAVYLPEHISREGLSDSMSSINTFRVVLGNAFGLDLPLLEDRAFFSAGDLDFDEVTDRVRE